MSKKLLSVGVLSLLLLLFSCNKANIYKEKAIKSIEKKDFTQALIEINKAIELAPDSLGNYSVRIIIYDLTGKYEEELTDLKRIIEMSRAKDKILHAYHQKAVVEFSLGLYNDALQDIDYFINNRDTVGSLAEAYINKGIYIVQVRRHE